MLIVLVQVSEKRSNISASSYVCNQINFSKEDLLVITGWTGKSSVLSFVGPVENGGDNQGEGDYLTNI